MTLARLRLATGGVAEILEEGSEDGPRRLFPARSPQPRQEPRVVVLHAAPPDGPGSGALLERMAAIQVVAHPGVVAPLATGELDGHAWVVEPVPARTLADATATRGGLGTAALVELVRGAARALEALHRRGITHGALAASLIEWDRGTVRLHGLGRVVGEDPQRDWQALGRIASEAAAGNGATLQAELGAVLERLRHAGFSGPTVTGDAILRALDRFPTSQHPVAESLVDGRGRGRRDPTERRTVLLAAVAGLLVLLWFLLRRP
ncbi:MAG: hypothetical protein KC485_06295 [Gemmatimonadetes bacterium]|nr:hypothetical protein [Gemmatimonadota bacterium]